MRQRLGILFGKGVPNGEPDRGRLSSGLRGYSQTPGLGVLNGEHLMLTPPGLRGRVVPKEGYETAPDANVTPPANSALILSLTPPQLPSMELIRGLSIHYLPSPEAVPLEFSHIIYISHACSLSALRNGQDRWEDLEEQIFSAPSADKAL